MEDLGIHSLKIVSASRNWEWPSFYNQQENGNSNCTTARIQSLPNAQGNKSLPATPREERHLNFSSILCLWTKNHHMRHLCWLSLIFRDEFFSFCSTSDTGFFCFPFSIHINLTWHCQIWSEPGGPPTSQSYLLGHQIFNTRALDRHSTSKPAQKTRETVQWLRVLTTLGRGPTLGFQHPRSQAVCNHV